MVYDPIRDCDVPSPAVSRRPSLWETPPPTASNPPHSAGSAPPPPPAFGTDRHSPAQSPSLRPPSGAGLRSLLNDENVTHPRRGSDVTTVSTDDEQHQSSRPQLSKLLNDRPTSRGQGQSHGPTAVERSPRLSSPSKVFAPPPLTSRVNRSPLISPRAPPVNLSSPASTSGSGYPFDLPPHHAGPSSRRSSIDTQRSTMPPPAEPVRHDSTGAYSSHSAPLRSPSASSSVSPRGQISHLPTITSRQPSSSRSTERGSQPPPAVSPIPPPAVSPIPPPAASPNPPPQRQLSEELAPVPASNGRPPKRKYEPYHAPPPRRPITAEELARMRAEAMNNNPLRKKAVQPPSWSAPSPRNSTDHGDFESGPSHSRDTSRRGSSAGAAGRPSHPSARNSDDSPLRSTDDGSKRSSHEAGFEDAVAAKAQRQSYSDNAAAVASHYNSRQEVGVEQREYSPIIGLKKFNNWIKSVLIGKFAYRARGAGAKVLDIGCGKGGDLNKWKQARISLYVGMDIAATSIDQARQRYNTLRGARFDGFFVAHDCYSRPISEVLPPNLERELYDNVSLQFCMHYAFETASKARMMMENVSRYLRPGGVFVGTIPNSSLLLERLDEIPEGEELSFGNSCYRIAFEERRHAGVYGHEYRFYLQDAVEDVPEYIVDWENFVSLAREYGLELIYRKTFNDVLQEEQESRDFGPLLQRMGVLNEHGESSMDSDQWEAANLYMAFAFEKV